MKFILLSQFGEAVRLGAARSASLQLEPLEERLASAMRAMYLHWTVRVPRCRSLSKPGNTEFKSSELG